jgi:hypothetical protein
MEVGNKRPVKEPRRIPPKRTGSSVSRKYESHIGDAVEEFLTSYGVTKEWWKEYKAKHGLPPTCGCDRRREYLNELSKAHPSLASIGVKFIAALKRK